MPYTHDLEFVGETVRKTFVSWSDSEPDREWAALGLLHEHAPGLAPRPLSRGEEAGRPVVTMSLVPGEPLAGPVSRRPTQALVAAVRRLFAVPVPADLQPRVNGPGELRSRFQPWLSADYDWGLCKDPVLVRDAVAEAQNWLRHHPPSPGWVVDPVVALGDGNLDNVLWDGEACRLIDWEEFGVSDLTYEVADLVEHASSRVERRLDVDQVLREFALDEPQRVRLAQHRRLFGCFWLAMLLPGNRGWHRNPRGATEDQAQHLIDLLGQ